MSTKDRAETTARALKYWADGTPEIRMLKEFSHPQRASIDVGANIGQFTWWMRRYAKQVIAFEPIPELAGKLRRSFTGDSSVIVREAAASNVSGTADLAIPVNNDGSDRGAAASLSNDFSSQRTLTVNLERIDDLDHGPIGFIKIDVEGHELDVLEGARETLLRDHPTLLVEIELRHHDGEIASKVAEICDLGYRAEFLFQGKIRPFEDFVDDMQDLEKIGSPSDYINNFIFRV